MSKHSPDYVHASYLYSSIRLDEFKKKLVHAKRVLRSYKFDAIAIRGMSGALIGVPLAHLLKKNILIVRKAGENNHSGRGVEGDKATQRYIIADDLVDSGRTMGEMLRAIKTFAPQAVCVGVLEWNDLSEGTSSMMVPDSHYTDSKTLGWDEFGRSSELVKSKETYEKSKQLQAAACSEAEVSPESAFDSTFYGLGLRSLAEQSKPKADYIALADYLTFKKYKEENETKSCRTTAVRAYS